MSTRSEFNSGAKREWLDLKEVTKYASVSERTLREWIHRASNPLPAVRVGAKILVRKSTFDTWLESHTLRSIEATDVDGIAGEILAELTGQN